MRPYERENSLYKGGKRCQISNPEQILFEYLDKYVNPGSRVLDIGCGSGEITQKIREKRQLVAGLDFSSVAIDLAKSLGLDCQVVDLDGGIPFENNTFDAVWAGDVIEHVFDPIFVLKEVNRVLRKGGVLLCSIPYDLRLTTRLKMLMGHSYQESVYRKFGQYKHHTFFSLPLIKYMLNESSLKLEAIAFVIRLPKLKKEFITKNRALIGFAKTMAITAISV